MRKLREKMKMELKYLKAYAINLVLCILAIVPYIFADAMLSAIEASYEKQEEDLAQGVTVKEESLDSGYNYFLDFSPSMQGFFSENINSNMHVIAETLQDMSSERQNNNFYWCVDEVEQVSKASDFYESILSAEAQQDYYQKVLYNASGTVDAEAGASNGQIDSVVRAIDLSKIFTSNDVKLLDDEKNLLNVIVTDMNFLISQEEVQHHNELMESFAERLGENAKNANICMYAIASNYEGEATDTPVMENVSSQIISNTFYIIVFSNSETVYEDYCEEFESTLSKKQIDYSGKFELLNKIYDSTRGLKVDLNANKMNAMLDNDCINLANGMFENLKENEMAIQLVKNPSNVGTLDMMVSELSLAGYYIPESEGVDTSELEMEVEIYRPKEGLWKKSYNQLEEVNLLWNQSAAMLYQNDKWYLKMNLTLNTGLNIPKHSSWYQQILENMGRRYVVMDIGFYMNVPSYTKPEWVASVSYPEVQNGDVEDIEAVIDVLIQKKQKAYEEKPREDRYLGNAVIYVLY